MELKKSKKLDESLVNLKKSLKLLDDKKIDQDVVMLSVHKAFEVAVEYAWKDFKRFVESEGLEAPSPKEAVRQAAKIHIIDHPEKWIEFINLRNNSVHDYFGVNEEYDLKLVREFLKLAEKL